MNFAKQSMIVLAFYSSMFTLAAQTSKKPVSPVSQSVELETKVDQLVAHMTLKEKVSQLVVHTPAIPRLGVPSFYYWNEGLHGVARKGYATNFPQAIGLGATWDTPLIHQVGDVISTEARAFHNAALRPGYRGTLADLTYWSPNINIFRDPRWGRGQETYGEDPYLTARMGVAFIHGLQGDDPNFLKVVATPKHYAVHSGPEPIREKFNVDVRPHDLEDTYMPAFRAAITEAHAGSIMCAYSAVDGVPACASEMLLQSYLRKAWKFRGFVVSDCDAIDDVASAHHYAPDAVHGAAVSVAAGTDLDCGQTYLRLEQAVENHLVPESAIDTAVKNVFMMRMRIGLFAQPGSDPYDQIAPSELDSPKHRALSLQAARESIVLLKNENKTLPFKSDMHTIAVIGPNAEYLSAIEGNYMGTLKDPVYPLEGIENEFAGRAKVLYTQGASLASGIDTPVPSYTLSSVDGKRGLTAEYFNNTTFSGEPTKVRVDEHVDFDWREASPVEGLGVQNYSIRWSGTFTPPGPGLYTFQANTNDCKACKTHEQFKLVIDDKVVLDSSKYQSDTAGKDKEDASIAFSDGRAHSIRYEYVHRTDRAGTTLLWRAPEDVLLAAALKTAEQADAVVAFVGITQHQEGEGHDRTNIDLPESQEKMLEALGATGKPLVVVLLNGSELAVNWANQHAQAIIEAWYPGEAGGTAIAETLSGANNPAGRLPVTFYSSLSQVPDFTDYTMTNRTYRYFTGKPLYEFGYGLSYSTFSYSALKLSASKLKAGQTLSVEAEVRNDSDRDGDEVAELYLEAPKGPGIPKWSLEGFSRNHIPAHQSRTVSFELSPRQLSQVDAKGNRSEVAGTYTIVLGGSQPDAGLPMAVAKFNVTGSLRLER